MHGSDTSMEYLKMGPLAAYRFNKMSIQLQVDLTRQQMSLAPETILKDDK